MIDALQRIRDGRCPVSCPATLAKRMVDVVGGMVNRYPKLSPFVFYPLLLLILASVVLSLQKVLAQLL